MAIVSIYLLAYVPFNSTKYILFWGSSYVKLQILWIYGIYRNLIHALKNTTWTRGVIGLMLGSVVNTVLDAGLAGIHFP